MRNQDFKTSIESPEAFSLLELTVSVAILGIVAYAVASSLLHSNQVDKQLNQMATIDELFLTLRATLMDESAIANTLHPPDPQGQQINKDLLGCLQGLALYGWQPSTCMHAASHSFILYNQSPTNPVAVTGYMGVTNGAYDATKDQPKMYTLDGVPCAANQPRCLIQVTSGFKSFCATEFWDGSPPNTGISCPEADFVEFDLTVSSLPDPATGQPAFPTLKWVSFSSRIDGIAVKNPSGTTTQNWNPI